MITTETQIYFDLLSEVFEALEKRYPGVQIPEFPPSVSYGTTERLHLKRLIDAPDVMAIIYRMDSGRYELTAYEIKVRGGKNGRR